MTSKKTVQAFEDIPGHELLKPLTGLKASQRMRLGVKLMKMVGDAENFSIDDFEGVADFMAYLEDNDFIVDPEGWIDFFDEAGMEGVVALITAYAGEAIGAKQ